MKQVYKCDYCSFMGTEEEVREHEPKCPENYDRRSCSTCKNRGRLRTEEAGIKYDCEKGKDIPVGKEYINCDSYEQKEKPIYEDFMRSIFGRGVNW